jgi:hypothetical protein
MCPGGVSHESHNRKTVVAADQAPVVWVLKSRVKGLLGSFEKSRNQLKSSRDKLVGKQRMVGGKAEISGR